MKTLLLFLRVMLLVFMILLIINLGFRILSAGIKFWYISIPLLVLIYLLVTNYWKNLKAESDFKKRPFHPYEEIKPEKEPEVTDIDESDTKDNDRDHKG